MKSKSKQKNNSTDSVITAESMQVFSGQLIDQSGSRKFKIGYIIRPMFGSLSEEKALAIAKKIIENLAATIDYGIISLDGGLTGTLEIIAEMHRTVQNSSLYYGVQFAVEGSMSEIFTDYMIAFHAEKGGTKQ